MANKVFFVFFWALLLLGGWLGWALSAFPSFEFTKLLFVLGLSYELFGVIVLWEVVTSRAWLANFIVNWLSGILVWANTIVPLGASIVSVWLFIGQLAQLVEPGSYPSAQLVAPAAALFMFYSFIPGIFVHDYVFIPKSENYKNLEARSRFFGGFLVISGIAVQLIGAVLDLLR